MNTISRRTFVAAVCASGLNLAMAADAYPAGPIKLVIPAGPGGTADNVARTLSAKVSASLGQPIVMDYKPGASGLIAEELVAKAPADGLVMLLDHSVFAMNPILKKGVLKFDMQKDLRPVTCLVRYQHMLIVPANSPAGSLRDLIALGKANPGKLNYGTAGAGTPQHIMAELFLRSNGITSSHVPYKGGAQQLLAASTGEVDFTFVAVSTAQALAKSGKVKVLAVLDDVRSRAFPDVPNFAELGQPAISSPWLGIFVPRATPEATVQRIYQEYLKVLKEPQTMEWIAAESLKFIGSTPTDFAQAITAEVAFNEKLAKELDLKPE